MIVIIGSYVYLLDQNAHSIVVYRALGANTLDLLIISLGYLVEISLTIIVYGIAIALLIALIISGIDATYLTGVFTDFYGYTPDNTLLIGCNVQIFWTIGLILLAAPLSLLLTLDQFSIKHLSRKLKRD